jgi:simple sugar transport system permease protein
VTTEWIAKNRTTLIVTVVVLVAAYVFYYAENGHRAEHVHLGLGLRHPARARPPSSASSVSAPAWSTSASRGRCSSPPSPDSSPPPTAARSSSACSPASAAGLILGGFLAWTTVKWRMDQIIAGVVLNIIATGITSFYYTAGQQLPGLMPSFDVPLLSRIPLFGPVFFTGTSVFAILAILAALFVHFGPVPHPVGPAHQVGRRVPVGRRHGRHQRPSAALVNVTLAGAPGRLRRRLPVDGRLELVRAQHGRRPRASWPWRS